MTRFLIRGSLVCGSHVRGLGMDINEIIFERLFSHPQAVPKIGLGIFGVLNGSDRHSQVLAEAAIQGAGGDGQRTQAPFSFKSRHRPVPAGTLGGPRHSGEASPGRESRLIEGMTGQAAI